jgi:hypothetical protein
MKFSSRMREIVPAAIAGFLSLPTPAEAKTGGRWRGAGVCGGFVGASFGREPGGPVHRYKH